MRNPVRPGHLGGRLAAKTLLGVLVGLAVAGGVSAPASADFSYRQLPTRSATADCKTVTTHIAGRPDSGTAGDWALDEFDRTVQICADATVDTKAKVAVGDTWKYQASASDTGTFTTTGPKSPGAGKPLAAGIVGAFNGTFKVTFVGPAAFGGLNEHPASTNAKSSSQWIGYIWPSSTGGDKLTDWGWTYQVCNELWTNALKGNHGDITGTSRIPCYGNPSFTSKCDGTVVVLLVNAAPSADSVAVYKVSGATDHNGLVFVHGGKPGTASVTVTLDAKGVVTVTYGLGDKKTTKTYVYAKPKDCTSPTPSASGTATASPSAPAGLPVTGPNAAVYGGGAAALLITGGVLFLVARRRRVRFEA